MVPDWASMKRAGVDGASATIGGKEFRECGVEVVRYEGGNDILVTIWNDKEVASTCRREIILPTRARENAWLRTTWARSLLFSGLVHGLDVQHLCLSFFV